MIDASEEMKEPSDTAGTEDRPGPVARTAVAAGAVVQLVAVGVVLALGLAGDGAVADRLRAVPLAAVYGLPGLLALLAIRARGPLLLAAGVASLVLAVIPFSLHSFVFGPIGIVYLVAYTRWPTPEGGGRRSALVASLVPLLLLAAFWSLVWHDDPVCYTRHGSGEVTVDRNPDQPLTGTRTIEADSDVVESGCSSDTVVWWETATSLVLSTAGLVTAVALTGAKSR